MDLSHSKFGLSTLGGVSVHATRYTPDVRLCCLALLLLPLATRAGTIEHPGILHKDDNCSSCHADKAKGKSVHSAMEIPCTVCHLAQSQGDMTTLQLSLPKEEICFSCHEKSMLLQEHSPAVKRLCVDCHDAHSSDRPSLLREPPNSNHRNSWLISPTTTSTTGKTANQP